MLTIDIQNISSVYSGKSGACCCGCKGKHTYASTHQEWAGTHRGYAVRDDEVNDRTVKLIVNKILKADPTTVLENSSEMIAVDNGSRLLVAYRRTA
jgi:hypothetical protein